MDISAAALPSNSWEGLCMKCLRSSRFRWTELLKMFCEDAGKANALEAILKVSSTSLVTGMLHLRGSHKGALAKDCENE